MTTVWQISQMERTLADGGVVVCHWRATATDGDFSASSYGTAGFTPDPAAQTGWPYDEHHRGSGASHGASLTVLTRTLLKQSLAANIDGQINPTQAAGVPW